MSKGLTFVSQNFFKLWVTYPKVKVDMLTSSEAMSSNRASLMASVDKRRTDEGLQ